MPCSMAVSAASPTVAAELVVMIAAAPPWTKPSKQVSAWAVSTCESQISTVAPSVSSAFWAVVFNSEWYSVSIVVATMPTVLPASAVAAAAVSSAVSSKSEPWPLWPRRTKPLPAATLPWYVETGTSTPPGTSEPA